MSEQWFAQRGEDRSLRRLIGGRDEVYWIDVGAYDPIVDSVTEHFSRRGGAGVNIEPVPVRFATFPPARQRDVNLECGVSDKNGHQVITEIVDTGLSTFHMRNAMAALQRGHVGHRYMVKMRTLEDICNEFVPLGQHIDFLKIDVEGFEHEVILGANFHLYHPDYVVIEATIPMTEIPSYEQWEPDLEAAGYRLIDSSDNLNRFYQTTR